MALLRGEGFIGQSRVTQLIKQGEEPVAAWVQWVRAGIHGMSLLWPRLAAAAPL